MGHSRPSAWRGGRKSAAAPTCLTRMLTHAFHCGFSDRWGAGQGLLGSDGQPAHHNPAYFVGPLGGFSGITPESRWQSSSHMTVFRNWSILMTRYRLSQHPQTRSAFNWPAKLLVFSLSCSPPMPTHSLCFLIFFLKKIYWFFFGNCASCALIPLTSAPTPKKKI